jgi:hypothetical protein
MKTAMPQWELHEVSSKDDQLTSLVRVTAGVKNVRPCWAVYAKGVAAEAGKPDLEPLDTAESFFRAIRDESGLTAGAQFALLFVALLGVLGIAAALADALFGGPNGDIAGGALGAVVLGLVVGLVVLLIALDAIFRYARARARQLFLINGGR